MNWLHCKLLYRQFLFRLIDFELLNTGGDINRLLGQFAALLVLISSVLVLAAGGTGKNTDLQTALFAAWPFEQMLISTTMLVVGIFGLLSWDSFFPDRRDVFVLGPLPIGSGPIVAAKVAAASSALALAILCLNSLTGLALPFALTPPGSSLFSVIFSVTLYRLLFAYWVTMLLAGMIILCSMLAIQGCASLLPRHYSVRAAAPLQFFLFCLLVTVYFLQPPARASTLPAAAHWLPPFWFLGLFQQLAGAVHPSVEPLAQRAWVASIGSMIMAASAYALAVPRAIRQVAEQPDILPQPGLRSALPSFGGSLSTAIVQFSIRTLARSRHHRMMLAFYLGVGAAFTILLLRSGAGKADQVATNPETRQIFSSILIVLAIVVGVRAVFSLPVALKANWIFQITQVRPAGRYLAASRKALFVMAVLPAWVGCSGFFLLAWPTRLAAPHLAVLGLGALLAAYIALHGFRKIPFTCSYLPGRSMIHMVVSFVFAAVVLIGKAAAAEREALDHWRQIALALAALGVAMSIARWWVITGAGENEPFVEFVDAEPEAVVTLNLHS